MNVLGVVVLMLGALALAGPLLAAVILAVQLTRRAG